MAKKRPPDPDQVPDPPAIAGPVLPDRSKWPKYTEAEQTLLMTFLAAYLTEAEQARDAARELLARGPELAQSQGMVRYWENACQAIAWLAYRVPNKQKHLAMSKAAQEQGMTPP